MSLYLIVWLFLAVVAVVCVGLKKEPLWLVCLAFGVLCAMLFFRWGQGTDFYNYRFMYHSIPTGWAALGNFQSKVYGEVLYQLLEKLFRLFNLPFPIFLGCISLAQALLLGRFVWRLCGQAKTLALLLLYPTVWLTYCFSGLRQALVICLFLGVMLPLLQQRKLFAYTLIGLFCIGLHASAVVLLVLPLLLRLRLRSCYWLLPLCALAGGLLSTPWGISALRMVFHLMNKNPVYLAETGTSLSALAERTVTFFALGLVYARLPRRPRPDGEPDLAELLMKICCAGYGFYLLFCWQPMLASRLTVPLKFAGVALICLAVTQLPRLRGLILGYAVALTGVMTYKNIASYIDQGCYNGVTVFNFPYCSIFEPDRATALRELEPRLR